MVTHNFNKWERSDYAEAMSNAVHQNANSRFTRQENNKLKFNAFWRDEKKQTNCIFLDSAGWVDIKTGEKGGPKLFAEIAFNMRLPDFMAKFSNNLSVPNDRSAQDNLTSKEPYKILSSNCVDRIWKELKRRDESRTNHAASWLKSERGFDYSAELRCANLYLEDLELFNDKNRALIKHRLSLGPNLVAALRGVEGDQVQNFLFRALEDVPKNEKSRLLINAGGWSDSNNNPRAFGFPHLIKDFPNLVICEGMADYIAAECLLGNNESHLPIGASNADALIKWAQWLTENNFKGQVVFVYQLDSNSDGLPNSKEIGPKKALLAAKTLLKSGITATPFNWFNYLKGTTCNPSKIKDLADSISHAVREKECDLGHLKILFQESLKQTS